MLSRNSYGFIRTTFIFQGMYDVIIGNAKISAAEDIRRHLLKVIFFHIYYFTALHKALLILTFHVAPIFYIIHVFRPNFGLPSELTVLTTVLSSAEHLLMLLVKHESLTFTFVTLYTFVVKEIVVMKLLLEIQLALIRCEFLQSLIKLKSAHIKLQSWFNSVSYKHAQIKATAKFFGLGSDLYFKVLVINLFHLLALKVKKGFDIAISGPQVQCSSLRLCGWTYEFYIVIGEPQCSSGDFDHAISVMKSPNFVQLFATKFNLYIYIYIYIYIDC
uniref:Uncharacterized protein n=1 Tax=Wuchereria bancrofti TaxID=6293 RepID=A0A1I8EBI2_WUCBA